MVLISVTSESSHFGAPNFHRSTIVDVCGWDMFLQLPASSQLLWGNTSRPRDIGPPSMVNSSLPPLLGKSALLLLQHLDVKAAHIFLRKQTQSKRPRLPEQAAILVLRGECLGCWKVSIRRSQNIPNTSCRHLTTTSEACAEDACGDSRQGWTGLHWGHLFQWAFGPADGDCGSMGHPPKCWLFTGMKDLIAQLGS